MVRNIHLTKTGETLSRVPTWSSEDWERECLVCFMAPAIISLFNIVVQPRGCQTSKLLHIRQWSFILKILSSVKNFAFKVCYHRKCLKPIKRIIIHSVVVVLLSGIIEKSIYCPFSLRPSLGLERNPEGSKDSVFKATSITHRSAECFFLQPSPKRRRWPDRNILWIMSWWWPCDLAQVKLRTWPL